MEALLTELTDAEKESIYIAGGFGHPQLTHDIAEALGVEEGEVEQGNHPNGEIYSRFGESVRGKHVFLSQSHVGSPEHTVNDVIMQQLLLADAARSSSATEITAVSPYLAYMRQDRKARGREPIAARVLLDQLATSGVKRVVTVDMHSAQSQAIFRGPFDHLTAEILLRNAVKEEVINYDHDELLVVAPDAGAAKKAELHRTELGVGLLHLAKMRNPKSREVERDEELVPEADGRVCLVFDDMIDSGGTIITAAESLKNSGAKAIYVAATHGILSGDAAERLANSPIEKVILTDTFPTEQAKTVFGDKLRVVSVAGMIAEALVEIIQNGSVSRLFDDHNYS